mmetsp:Transcript_1796/g.5755  ORF Transcript_1796/g.5755 Transcript_1796/m.5755 type:complete len:268 (+) Transcript_1796:479-1282(+)
MVSAMSCCSSVSSVASALPPRFAVPDGDCLPEPPSSADDSSPLPRLDPRRPRLFELTLSDLPSADSPPGTKPARIGPHFSDRSPSAQTSPPDPSSVRWNMGRALDVLASDARTTRLQSYAYFDPSRLRRRDQYLSTSVSISSNVALLPCLTIAETISFCRSVSSDRPSASSSASTSSSTWPWLAARAVVPSPSSSSSSSSVAIFARRRDERCATSVSPSSSSSDPRTPTPLLPPPLLPDVPLPVPSVLLPLARLEVARPCSFGVGMG